MTGPPSGVRETLAATCCGLGFEGGAGIAVAATGARDDPDGMPEDIALVVAETAFETIPFGAAPAWSGALSIQAIAAPLIALRTWFVAS